MGEVGGFLARRRSWVMARVGGYLLEPKAMTHRRSDRLIKKRQISHPDEEDPGAICVLLGAMKLNVWGGEEDYSVSLEQEEEKSDGKGRAKRARKTRVQIS